MIQSVIQLCTTVLRTDAASPGTKAWARDLLQRASPHSLGSIFG